MLIGTCTQWRWLRPPPGAAIWMSPVRRHTRCLEIAQALVCVSGSGVGPRAAGLAPTQIPWQRRAGPPLPSYIIIPSLPACLVGTELLGR